MRLFPRIALVVAALAIAVFAVPGAWADNFSFTGSLTGDNDVQLFTFSVGSTSTVTLETLSYAGGVNSAGQTIPEGGFDPILALFDSTGALINQNDDGGANVPADSVTGEHYDTYLQDTLGPGTYTVGVMEYPNFAIGPNLSDGFQVTDPNYTGSYNETGACSQFVDVTGSCRTAN
jgi:hypothetical protein